MKLTKNWHSNKTTHKTKRFGPKPRKISLQFFGLPGQTEEKKSNSIDEVRRQAVLMSSAGFREALPSSPLTSAAKSNAKNKQTKQRRGVTK